jgi:hypothetical protein
MILPQLMRIGRLGRPAAAFRASRGSVRILINSLTSPKIILPVAVPLLRIFVNVAACSLAL